MPIGIVAATMLRHEFNVICGESPRNSSHEMDDKDVINIQSCCDCRRNAGSSRSTVLAVRWEIERWLSRVSKKQGAEKLEIG